MKSLTETVLNQQQQQLHHAHLMANGLVLTNTTNGLGSNSSQSSSLGGSGNASSANGSGNDLLLHNQQQHLHLHHSRSSQNISSNLMMGQQYTNLANNHLMATSHQLRAAQRRSLQLIAANNQTQNQMVNGNLHHNHDNEQQEECDDQEEEDEQGVLSADESVAMHRRQYRLSTSTNGLHQQQNQYLHSNEGFRDSNELTVGPDTRSVNTNTRASRIFSINQQNRLHHATQATNLNNNNAPITSHRRLTSSHGSGSSQHQRLVGGSSSATTTSSPSTSTRSSRASPEHSDDVDLDRLAYGNNWQQH